MKKGYEKTLSPHYSLPQDANSSLLCHYSDVIMGPSNHQPHDCLLNHLFGRRSKKTSKLRVTGLCVGNSPGTGEFPTQRASNAENVSISWRHHVLIFFLYIFYFLSFPDPDMAQVVEILPHGRRQELFSAFFNTPRQNCRHFTKTLSNELVQNVWDLTHSLVALPSFNLHFENRSEIIIYQSATILGKNR